MKSIILSFVILISLCIYILQGQTISNIAPAERTDGTMMVDILYDLSGPDPAYDVSAEVSFDNGVNYAAIDSVSGDIGAGITTGTGKHIVWKFGSEFPGHYTSQAKIKLIVLVSTAQCGSPFVDARDGQSYNTVQIGTQCWMAENLNIGTMVNGSSSQLNNSIIEKYCYNDNTSNCDVYGGLYQWDEMMQYVTTPGTQGICPSGWHLPTDAEWCVLEQFVDASISCSTTEWRGVDGGGKLKEAGTTHWFSPNDGATNSSGFTALPGGYRGTDGSFYDHSYYGYFWSSSENGINAWYRILRFNSAQVNRFGNEKAIGFSTRCIKDETLVNQPPATPSNPNPANSAINQPINSQLSWTCTDPENDLLTYDVYFSTTNPPSFVVTVQSATTCNPGTLVYSTTYYWKIVAHDNHSNTTTGPVWSFTTMAQPVWSCWQTLTVTHTAGNIAPVNKTVNYGTVLTNLTGSNKCWITQNLGSDQQATAATDATEASAGWYWQFNRKQGYKHDGSTRTPNSTWILSINENSDWLPANDPCTLLLGTGWRLPTSTEWINADANGGWNNYNQTYASILKLHAAGYLGYSNGLLYYRGSYGFYWSGTQDSSTNGRVLNFISGNSNVYFYNKAYGFSGRCLRD